MHPVQPELLTLDEASGSVILNGQKMVLTVIEFKLLQTLARRPGTIFTRDRLMSMIYTDGRIVSDRTIDSHIRKLRNKLTEAMPEQELIQSVYSAGYKLKIHR